MTQYFILLAAVGYSLATIKFLLNGQYLLALGWFTTVINVIVWSFVKELK